MMSGAGSATIGTALPSLAMVGRGNSGGSGGDSAAATLAVGLMPKSAAFSSACWARSSR